MNSQLPTITLLNKTFPKLDIGSWGIGGYMTKSPYSDYVNEITQIKYQLSKGLSLIDCWIAQGEGGSLELIRQSIEDFDREKVILLCKFDIHKYKDIVDLEHVFNHYLKQLNTSFLDIFQIHKPDFSRISEIELREFLQVKLSSKKIRAFAISNASLKEVKHIEKMVKLPIAFNELLYNVFDRQYENDGTIKYCLQRNIPILAYRPLNRGMTNIAHIDPQFGEIVKRYDLTPNQVALQWLLRKENVMALLKSSNRAHINENLDCMSVELSPEDMALLDSWKPQEKKY